MPIALSQASNIGRNTTMQRYRRYIYVLAIIPAIFVMSITMTDAWGIFTAVRASAANIQNIVGTQVVASGWSRLGAGSAQAQDDNPSKPEDSATHTPAAQASPLITVVPTTTVRATAVPATQAALIVAQATKIPTATSSPIVVLPTAELPSALPATAIPNKEVVPTTAPRKVVRPSVVPERATATPDSAQSSDDNSGQGSDDNSGQGSDDKGGDDKGGDD